MSTVRSTHSTSIGFGQILFVSLLLIFFILVVTESGLAGSGRILPVADQAQTINNNIPIFQKVDFTILQHGKASYYGRRFHGRKTACGQHFDADGFSAAHRTLPFGSILRVTNPESNASILVIVNDRGPFVRSRVIDLSAAAARSIDVSLGKVMVEGFKPNELAGDSILIGFTSPSYDAFRIPSSDISVIDTLNSFTEALRKHRLLSAKNPDKDLYLVILPSSADGSHLQHINKYMLATKKESNNRREERGILAE